MKRRQKPDSLTNKTLKEINAILFPKGILISCPFPKAPSLLKSQQLSLVNMEAHKIWLCLADGQKALLIFFNHKWKKGDDQAHFCRLELIKITWAQQILLESYLAPSLGLAKDGEENEQGAQLWGGKAPPAPHSVTHPECVPKAQE